MKINPHYILDILVRIGNRNIIVMKKVRFIQMLPNDALQLRDKVQITTNSFCDIEVKFDDDDHVLIHIVGFPKVKRVIYG